MLNISSYCYAGNGICAFSEAEQSRHQAMSSNFSPLPPKEEKKFLALLKGCLVKSAQNITKNIYNAILLFYAEIGWRMVFS